ncbi:hypothetical protein ACFQJD_09425 [Haloplanus sp. GCM10025708]|uniref:DUF7519 family protein n=1 Tax=Haloferacaceae TaxID=1644056 RepID=UPI00361B6D90
MDTQPTSDDANPTARTGSVADDNWRPTRAGTTVSVLVTVAVVAALIAVGGDPLAAVASAAGGLSLAVVLLASGASRWRIPARVAAGVLLLPAGALLVFGVGRTLTPGPVRPGLTLLVFGVGVAAGGAAATPWDAVDARRLWGVTRFGIGVLVLPAVVLGVLVVANVTPVGRAVGAVVALAGDVLLATDQSWRGVAALPVASMLVNAVCFGAWASLRALPIAELVAADRRDAVAELLERAMGHLTSVGLTSVALTPAFALLWLAPTIRARVFGALPASLVTGVVGVASATPLRVLLLGVTGLSVAVVGLVAVVKRLSDVDAESFERWGAPAVGGLLFIAVALQFGAPATTAAARGPLAPQAFTIRQLSETFGPEALSLGVELALASVSVAVYLTLGLLGAVLFPGRGESAAVASVGVFLAAVGSARVGVPPVVVFVAVAASLVVWDVSDHAVAMGTEVGRAAPTRHVELVHAGGSLLVGGVGVAVAVGGLLGAGAVPVLRSVATPLALLSALVGVLFLLAALRSA